MVSFLIGSGFSAADGLPMVSDINKRMCKIKESEFLIHTDGTTVFLNGEENLNEWSRKIERIFVQDFLNFYCTSVINGVENFHYENFYDYYSEYLRESPIKDSKIDEFCDHFRDRYNPQYSNIWDNYNLITHFHSAFSQLLSSLLQRAKYHEDIGLGNYHPYDNFIRFLKILINENIIKIHTLNHDLLFEHLGKILWQDFSDGFSEQGSPYYSYLKVNSGNSDFTIKKTYRVRLKYFQNKFDKKICLFKLHGSLDTFQFDRSNLNDYTRIKADYGIEPRFVKEIKDSQTNELRYERGLQNTFPDFLSGTTEKMRSYDNEYYSVIFNHFFQNLQSSNLLIVIGYGFGDPGINKYLKDYFLNEEKKMFVINPSERSSELSKFSYGYLKKRIQDVTFEEFLSIINY